MLLSEKEKEALHSSGLFDPEWYVQRYADVGMSGLNPFEHFVQIGIWLERNPCADFNSASYRLEHGLDARQTIPILHFLGLEAQQGFGSFQQTLPSGSCASSASKEPLHFFLDFPVERDLVGHDYIRVIGWCYIYGEQIASVRAEILGSRKPTSLRFGIFRPDVAAAFPNLAFFSVGFEGDVYPWNNGARELELRVVASTERGAVHETRKKLVVDTSLTGRPSNRNTATSELSQILNGQKLIFP